VAAYLFRRSIAALLLLVLVVSAAFALLHALPGGPNAVAEDPRVPPGYRARMRTALGLDRPLPVQYVDFVTAAARGNWGISFARQLPVSGVVVEAASRTIELAGAALLIEFLLGVPLGALAARRAGGVFDHATRAVALTLWSIPSFTLGLLLLVALALAWPVFPAGGLASAGAAAWPPLARFVDRLAHLTLPALALGLPAAAATARFVRAALLEIANEPFVTAARARGVGGARLFFQHLLRPASGSLVELAGLSAAALVSGSLAVEVVFSRPGLGRLAFDSLTARDYPVLLAATAVSAGGIVVASLAADILQAALDPRHRQRELAD